MNYKPPMFGFSRPAPFRIDGVMVYRGRRSGRLIAQVSGAGFGTHVRALVNGSPYDTFYTLESPELLTVDFPATEDETIKVTLAAQNRDPKKTQTVESEAVANPAFPLSVAEVEFVTYESWEEESPDTILVKIKGTGFTDSLTATLAERVFPVAVKSATEASFAMPDPKGAVIMTPDHGREHKTKVIVARMSKTP